MPPHPHGTTQRRTLVRILTTTAANAYRLDVDQLATEVLQQQDRTYKQAGAIPCVVHLHPHTRREVMRHRRPSGSQPYWQAGSSHGQPDTFVGINIVVDEDVPLGYATLETCAGCMSITARCEHKTDG